MFSFHITHFSMQWMWLSVDTVEKNQALQTVQWCFLAEAMLSVCVGVAPLQYWWAVGCRLFCLWTFSFFSFRLLIPLISLTVASLQGVAQDFMLSCNHCLNLSLFSVIFMSCWSLLQPPQLCSLLYLLLSLSVVVLHRCRFFVFWGDPLSSSSVCWLALFWLSDTPSPLPAVRSPMVQCCACLQFCGWSVGLSPVHVQLCRLVLCCGLSSEWTMCIKLHSFLVWHRLIPTLRMSNCHVEVMLSWRDFPFGKVVCGELLIMNLMKLRMRQWQWQWRSFGIKVSKKHTRRERYTLCFYAPSIPKTLEQIMNSELRGNIHLFVFVTLNPMQEHFSILILHPLHISTS